MNFKVRSCRQLDAIYAFAYLYINVYYVCADGHECVCVRCAVAGIHRVTIDEK